VAAPGGAGQPLQANCVGGGGAQQQLTLAGYAGTVTCPNVTSLCAPAAALVAADTAALNLPAVRAALLDLQHGFRRLPGLVADGRDMGTVVFPDAALKVYLTASAERRAQRRYKQLISKGISATLESLCADLAARDLRDTTRAVAPLKPAQDAALLDNSELTVDQSVTQVLDWWQSKQLFEAS
jgi:cytidylate kinase